MGALPADDGSEKGERVMAAAARAAHVDVDCRRWDGVLRRIWTSFGYDELNWTATTRQAEPGHAACVHGDALHRPHP
jgi:hypothetical protein